MENEVAKNIMSKETSIISSKTSSLEPLRPTAATLQSWHIEAVHIAMFFLLLIFLFLGMWKDGKKTKF